MKRLLPAVVAVSAAVTWAGAVAPMWPAAAGMAVGVRPPGAGDGSPAGAARPAGSWRRAIEVPGLGALNKGGYASVSSVSCVSAGSCTAGGYYTDRHGHRQGFVAVERNGRSGTAIEVPGLATLNKGGYAEVTSVSCVSAGSCVAGGRYTDRHGLGQGFVAAERNGVWGRATGVPGLEVLNRGGGAGVDSVSCASAGNCAAGGSYAGRHGHPHAFVVSQRHGRWGMAIQEPRPGALKVGRNVVLGSVSCGSAGGCAAAGFYYDNHGLLQGFVVSRRHGVWGRAIEVPGQGTLNKGGNADVLSVSCGPAGSCAAGGFYADASRDLQGFVAVEHDGVWGSATGVPGLAALNSGGYAFVGSVSCPSAGNCAAGGQYSDHKSWQGFVAVEHDGVWGTATGVPGLAALNVGGAAEVTSVSCASAGNCAAIGQYGSRGGLPLFVVSEKNGVWGRAIEVPGLATLNKGGGGYGADATSVSCAPAGTCTACGSYTDASGHSQGFIVSQTG